MNACIVDASVVAAAFFREDVSAGARRLLSSGCELHAPDLVYAEVANVIWKRQNRREIDDAEARELLSDVLRLPLRITPGDSLAEAALTLAMRADRSVYDCLYLALAVQRKSVMVTGDKRLVNALAETPLKKHVAWIGQIR
ncbi:MAG: type II toxin-antitoxin system VapC family toxin [Phycisphaerae bacterium]|nr:type II toxin-antitoxin system VapC family toxin [Phycisphaerae bacterium]